MTPEEVIADLDHSLDEDGQDVVLQCFTLGPSGLQIPYSVTVRAFVRGIIPRTADELVQGITQDQSSVIMSPTQINAKNWPGPDTTGIAVVDRRIPSKNRKDKIVINGKPRSVEAGVGVYLQNELVRIEARVLA